jgi:hypothetical protein
MRIAATAIFAFTLPLAIAQGALAQGSALAPAPSTAPAVCLRQNMVWGWNVVDDKTLIVTDKVQKAYKVSLRPGCFDLKWHLRLSLRSYSGMGLACLSRNDFLIVPPEAGMPAQRCLIADIAAYTPPPK